MLPRPVIIMIRDKMTEILTDVLIETVKKALLFMVMLGMFAGWVISLL